MTPCSASQRASSSTSVGRRLTNEPRKLGIAQNEQRRSQPLASLSGAIGPPSRRRRRRAGRSRAPGTGPGRAPRARGRQVEASRSTGRDRQQPAAVRGRVRVVRLAGHDRAQPRGDVGVVVEAEHRVGLGQRLGEVLAVALGQAADRHDGLGAAVLLEVGGLEQRVDGVLLGRLDEAAGVDDDGVGVGRGRRRGGTRRPPAARPAPRSRPRCGRSPRVTSATRQRGRGTGRVLEWS